MSKPADKNNCKNCQAQLNDGDVFCPKCGQKVLDQLTLSYFVNEFLNNYFSFDSKFLKTVRYLISKPSFLSSEFIEGRRRRYINPIQLFIFCSFLYFFFNSFMFLKESGEREKVTFSKGDQRVLVDSLDLVRSDSVHVFKDGEDSITIENPYMKRFIERGKEFNNMDKEYRNEKVSGNISYAMFILMPIFAVYLRLFFRRRALKYLENLIFSLHFHAFYFVLGVVFLLVDRLLTGDIDTFLLNLFALIYLWVASKRFFRFSWWNTTLRFLGLILIYGATVSLTLIASILLSIFT